MEAYSQDELVARFMKEPDEAPKAERRMSEYSVEVEILSTLVDRMSEMIQALLASRGVKPRRIPPSPRPVTAFERMRKERRRTTHESLVSRLLPNKGKKPAAPAVPAVPGRRAAPRPELPKGKPHRGFGS